MQVIGWKLPSLGQSLLSPHCRAEQRGLTVGSWKLFLFHTQSFSIFSKNLTLHSIFSCFLLIFSLSASYFILPSCQGCVWRQFILSCHHSSWRADPTGQYLLFWLWILGYTGMLKVLGSRPAAILRCSFLRKLLRWDQAVLRMAEERGRTYCLSALALLGADS